MVALVNMLAALKGLIIECTPNGNETKVGKTVHCLVCEKVIKEHSGHQKGQDAIMCEGECKGWYHRTCAGITTKAFQEATNSPHPFYCHQCTTKRHETNIAELKASIQSLKGELADLKAKTQSESFPASPGVSLRDERPTTYFSVASKNL